MIIIQGGRKSKPRVKACQHWRRLHRARETCLRAPTLHMAVYTGASGRVKEQQIRNWPN